MLVSNVCKILFPFHAKKARLHFTSAVIVKQTQNKVLSFYQFSTLVRRTLVSYHKSTCYLYFLSFSILSWKYVLFVAATILCFQSSSSTPS